jgi:hypothetical protein
MTVAELIVLLSEVEDQTMNVMLNRGHEWEVVDVRDVGHVWMSRNCIGGRVHTECTERHVGAVRGVRLH